MGLEHLLEALEREADAQIERLLAEARAEADRLTAAGTAALEQRRRAAAEAGERARAQDVERATTMARRTARRAILEARGRLLERVFAAARGALPAAASGAAYRASLPAAVAAATTALGDAPAVIRAPPALIGDLERLRQPGGAVTVVADAETGSGFRAVAADGALEVDDTLESRLERLRPELARRVLARLTLAP